MLGFCLFPRNLKSYQKLTFRLGVFNQESTIKSKMMELASAE